MVEVVARAAFAGKQNMPQATFSSAGVAVATVRGPADPRAVACVAARGLALTDHSTTQVDAKILRASDRIYALDRGIRDRLLEIAPSETKSRISLLTSLIPNATISDIDDPYAGTADDYEIAFALISRAVDALAASLASDNG